MNVKKFPYLPFQNEYPYLWDFQKAIDMKRLLYAIIILIAVIGCKEVFEDPPKAFLYGTFYNSTTNLAISPSVTLQGVGREELLYDEQSTLDLLMPLTIKDTTRFIIWIDSTADSLTFVHQTTQKLASVETGFYYEYKLLSVAFTQTRIDSITIVDSLVTTQWNENIKLYIQPLPDSGN